MRNIKIEEGSLTDFRRLSTAFSSCLFVTVHVCPCVLSCVQVSATPWLWPSRFLCPWDSPGKNTGVGCIPSSRESSRPRDWTFISCISCIGGGFYTTAPPWKSLFVHGSSLFFKNYLFIWLCWVLVSAYGIQLPDRGSNPGPLHWELRVSATGPPEKSQAQPIFWKPLIHQ